METVQDTHRPRVAVFGGSFDPVHRGHLEVIEAVLRAVDHVFVIPAHRSPFKDAPRLLPAELRYEMLRAALRGLARVSVLDLEIRRAPPSYTVDTLEALSAWMPRAHWSLVLGADAFAGFAQWRRADRILELCDVLLFGRNPGSAPSAEAFPPLESLAGGLPEPWRKSARPGPEDTLRDAAGRILLRRVTATIAAVSSSGIRQRGAWSEVPPGARELIEAYEKARAPAGIRPAQEPPCSTSA